MNDSIFTPEFNLTPAIEGAIEEIDRKLIENVLLMPKHETWLRREVAIQRASGTTRIEGASLDETAVSNLLRKGPTGKLSDDEEANLNAVRAYEFVDYLSDQADIPIDELVIRQLNREFLYGASETLSPGVYRNGQNTVGRFIPPDQGDVPAQMRAFALWLRADDDDLHPILKAGIAHIHLVAIHPFWDGNGRTARGVATLILQRSQFHFKKLLSLEKVVFDLRDDYLTAIERTLGDSYQPSYDTTPWLKFFARVLTAHALQLTGMLTDWHREMSGVHELFERKGLEVRQADGYVFALRTGRITRADYIEITNVSPSTASRDLAELVKVGMLVPKGKTKARVYIPSLEEKMTEKEQLEKQIALIPD